MDHANGTHNISMSRLKGMFLKFLIGNYIKLLFKYEILEKRFSYNVNLDRQMSVGPFGDDLPALTKFTGELV